MWIKHVNNKLVDFHIFFDLFPIFFWNIQGCKRQILCQESPNYSLRSITQGLFIVAAFQHHNKFLLNLEESLHHVGIRLRLHFNPSKRVSFRRVKTCWDVNQVRLKLRYYREKQSLTYEYVFSISRHFVIRFYFLRIPWYVYVVAFTFVFSDFAEMGIRRIGIETSVVEQM